MVLRVGALLLASSMVLSGPGLRYAPAQAPVVPDEAEFFARVRDNLVRAQRATPQFAYKEKRTRFHTNPFGRMGTDGHELAEVFPSVQSKLTYRRVLMRDGQPLSPAEIAAQDAEYRSRAADVRRRLQNETAAERRRRLEEAANARRRSRAMIDDIINALDIRITGRASHEGAPAITVAIQGRPSARPKTREGKIAQSFAGTAWIHAQQLEVMHVEGKTIHDVSFGFGMVARLNEGTLGSLTRRPVEAHLWMPTAVRVSGEGRAVLQLRKLLVDFKIDWYDYRRYDGTIPGLD